MDEEEEKPVELYIRVETASNGFKWFVIKKNAAALLSDEEDKSSSICSSCGAIANVTEPCFPPEINHRPYSSAVAVGDRFYVFGGVDVVNCCVDSLQVSYIDTTEGSWNLCMNNMPKGRDQPYPVTLNRNGIESVLLVGGFDLPPDNYPLEDKWVVIEKEPSDQQRPYSSIYGYACSCPKGRPNDCCDA